MTETPRHGNVTPIRASETRPPENGTPTPVNGTSAAENATPAPAAPPPPAYDCRRGGRRHKVITADRICVLCGARGVVDASQLPARPFDPTPTHDSATPLL